MKIECKSLVGGFVVGMVLLSGNLVLAQTEGSIGIPRYEQKMMQEMQDHITAMRDAAEALKTSNPQLSQKLSDMANMKENMMKMKANNGGMKENKMADSEIQDHLKTMRDAADALKTSKPELSQKISAMADRKEAMMNDKDKNGMKY